LESFTVVNKNLGNEFEIHFIQNERNDYNSVRGIYEQIIGDESKTTYCRYDSRLELLKTISSKVVGKVGEGDIVLAPYIRYKELWSLTTSLPSCVQKVHLSECLPDTFGHIGYRLGYRGNKLKSWLTLPLAKLYAMLNKPDLCYFPLYPFMKNPFVKNTVSVEIPPLLCSKKEKLLDLTNGEKRVLLIGGFGYDVKRMAKVLKLDRYIATAKGAEIIIDGETFPLIERICAEEVLMSGYVSQIVGYTSSAIVWAKIIDTDIKIDCYLASAFSRNYGPFFNFYAKRALQKMGIEVKEEHKEMLECL
jgi:hypothetical protein